MSEAELPIETDVQAVAAMLKNGDDFLLLDVREQDEYEIAKIQGSVLMPMTGIRDRVGELEEHRDRLVIVHCHHGGRSLRVTQFLREAGFAKCQNMAGGIDQWSVQVDDSIARY